MINREIKSSVVNVVMEDGAGLKQMTLTDAIELAEQTGEDVVCMKDGDIPVVKIMDYKKYLYEKNKKEKENKKKARLSAQGFKEVTFFNVIAEHDLKIKAKNVDRLLNEKNKVKISVRYRGREVAFINKGPQKLESLLSLLETNYKIEKAPKIEGKQVSMTIVPSKN